jgi:hypothetical protein
MNAFTNLSKWLKFLVPARRQVASRLAGSETGMEISFETAPACFLNWSEVSMIVAYKLDAFSTDLVCFGFVCRNESVITIDEDTAGFEAVVDLLPGVFPGFLEGWRGAVIQPPFARNETILWQADAAAQSCEQ